MKLCELFRQKSCVFSIECFPPKKVENYPKMQATLRSMTALQPDFISVTYGAGGSAGGVSTVAIADFLANELKVNALAHFVCMGNSPEKLAADLAALQAAGVENVLALRGDVTPLRPASPDFLHASDMITFIRQNAPGFGVSAACYPEGHPESASLKADLDGLRIKADAGAEHFITQLFFDNLEYYRFVNRARKAGLTLPVSAGVMPIVKKSQIERTVALSGSSMPPAFTRMIARWQDDPEALFDAGIDYAVTQLRDLIEGGADGVHLYAMNDFTVAQKVYDGIRDLL